jgi:hypothetical protein
VPAAHLGIEAECLDRLSALVLGLRMLDRCKAR